MLFEGWDYLILLFSSSSFLSFFLGKTIVPAFVFLFPNGTKSAFNKSGSDHARGKADAAHYQCPSLTTISYHPLLNYTATVPLALRELRVSFDQRAGGMFYRPSKSLLPVYLSMILINNLIKRLRIVFCRRWRRSLSIWHFVLICKRLKINYKCFLTRENLKKNWSKLTIIKIIIIIRILLNRIFLSYPHLRNSLLIYETLYLVSYIILWAKTWSFVICLHCIANNFKAFNALWNN